MSKYFLAVERWYDPRNNKLLSLDQIPEGFDKSKHEIEGCKKKWIGMGFTSLELLNKYAEMHEQVYNMKRREDLDRIDEPTDEEIVSELQTREQELNASLADNESGEYHDYLWFYENKPRMLKRYESHPLESYISRYIKRLRVNLRHIDMVKKAGKQGLSYEDILSIIADSEENTNDDDNYEMDSNDDTNPRKISNDDDDDDYDDDDTDDDNDDDDDDDDDTNPRQFSNDDDVWYDDRPYEVSSIDGNDTMERPFVSNCNEEDFDGTDYSDVRVGANYEFDKDDEYDVDDISDDDDDENEDDEVAKLIDEGLSMGYPKHNLDCEFESNNPDVEITQYSHSSNNAINNDYDEDNDDDYDDDDDDEDEEDEDPENSMERFKRPENRDPTKMGFLNEWLGIIPKLTQEEASFYGTEKDKVWSEWYKPYSHEYFTSTQDPDGTHQLVLDAIFEKHVYTMRMSKKEEMKQIRESKIRDKSDISSSNKSIMGIVKKPKPKPSMDEFHTSDTRFTPFPFPALFDYMYESGEWNAIDSRYKADYEYIKNMTASHYCRFVADSEDEDMEVVMNTKNCFNPNYYKTPTHRIGSRTNNDKLNSFSALGICQIASQTDRYYRLDTNCPHRIRDKEFSKFDYDAYEEWKKTGNYTAKIEYLPGDPCDSSRERMIGAYRLYREVKQKLKMYGPLDTIGHMAEQLGCTVGFPLDGRPHISSTYFHFPGAIEYYGYQTFGQLPDGVFIFVVDTEEQRSILTNIERIKRFEKEIGQTYIVVLKNPEELSMLACLSQMLLWRTFDRGYYYAACAAGRDKVHPQLIHMPMIVLPSQIVDKDVIDTIDSYPHMVSVKVHAKKPVGEKKMNQFESSYDEDIYPAVEVSGIRVPMITKDMELTTVNGNLSIPQEMLENNRNKSQKHVPWQLRVGPSGKNIFQQVEELRNKFRFIPKTSDNSNEGKVRNSWWIRNAKKQFMHENNPEEYKNRKKEIKELNDMMSGDGSLTPQSIIDKHKKDVFPAIKKLEKLKNIPLSDYLHDDCLKENWDKDVAEFLNLVAEDPHEDHFPIESYGEMFKFNETIPNFTKRDLQIIAKFRLFNYVPSVKQTVYKSQKRMFKLCNEFDKATKELKFDKSSYEFVDKKHNRIYNVKSERKEFKYIEKNKDLLGLFKRLCGTEIATAYTKDELLKFIKNAKTMYDLHCAISTAEDQLYKQYDKNIKKLGDDGFRDVMVGSVIEQFRKFDDLTPEKSYELSVNEFERNVFTPSKIKYSDLDKRERKFCEDIQKLAVNEIVEVGYNTFMQQYDKMVGASASMAFQQYDVRDFWSRLQRDHVKMHQIAMSKAKAYDRIRGDFISVYELEKLDIYRKEHRKEIKAEEIKKKKKAEKKAKQEEKLASRKFVLGKGLVNTKHK